MYCIYMHKNKVNGKIYIGQTCQKPEKRWNYGHGYKGCPRFYSAILHYGWDNFEHIILEDNLTQEDANLKEKYYIEKYQALDSNKGYNLIDGGNSLVNYWKDEKHREEQSKRKKQYFLNNPDKKEKNDEHLKNIAIKSAKQRSLKMRDNYFNGQGLYSLNEKRKRKILCVETNEIFNSLSEASRKYNISVGNISSVINGKRKTAGKFHWKKV